MIESFEKIVMAVISPKQNKLEIHPQPLIMVEWNEVGNRLRNCEENKIILSRDVRINVRETNYDEILKNFKNENTKAVADENDELQKMNENAEAQEQMKVLKNQLI